LLIQECCKQFKYKSFQAGEKIIKYGDLGDEFFIIMQGRVCVESPKTAVINLPEAYDPLTDLLLGTSLD